MSDGTDARGFYSRWARHYDGLATAPGIRSWRETAADALCLSSGDTVVEMGCGTGANFTHLRERVGPAGRVVGVDLTRGMLARADERIASAGWSNVHAVEGDATRLPLDGEVDAVLATFVVGMLPEPAAAVSDWLGLLASGGRLVLLNAARSPRWWAAPLNVAFAGFVRLTSPGNGSDAAPADVLEERIAAATAALEAGTASHDRRVLAGGFLRLRSGRVSG